MQRNKVLVGVIVVLVILNIVSLSFIWTEQDHQEEKKSPRVERYLGKRLKLDEEQVTFFKKSRKEHFERTSNLMAEIAKLRSQLAVQIENEASDSLLNSVAAKYRELEKLNHEHFRRLRSICDGEQKVKFDSMLIDLSRRGQLRRRSH